MKYRICLLALAASLLLVSSVPSFAQSQDDVADQLGMTRQQGSLPMWVRPDSQSLSQLGQTVRDFQQGVLIVGCREGGHGTAFVISRQHRLLATNAHVADILHTAGSLNAVINGETSSFQVQQVWYHPGVVRYLGDSKSMIARSQDPQDGSVCPLGPDVAVLQLADGGPGLPEEFTLATPVELANLFAQPVGMLGFPGHDSRFPELNQLPLATYHQGVVSRVTDFQGRNAAEIEAQQLIQHTAAGWGGFSGSPIFLANGHVVALHNMGRNASDRGATQRISHGVRIDCLWELLAYHRLDRLVPLPVNRDTLNVQRFEQPDPAWEKFQRVVQLVYEADALRQQRKFNEASQKCKEAKQLVPDFPLIHLALLQIHTDYVTAYESRVSSQVVLQQLGYALDNAKAYVQKVTSDPRALILYAHAYSNYAAAQYRVSKDEAPMRKARMEAIELLTRILDSPGVEDELRAETLNYRAHSRMTLLDFDGAFGDYQEAIRLDPTEPLFYTNRAELLQLVGRHREAQTDLQKAEQLRRQPAVSSANASPTVYRTWSKFVCEDGRFQAVFPGPPKVEVNDNTTSPTHMFTFSDRKASVEYLIAYSDLPVEVVQLNTPVDRVLDAFRDSVVDDTMKVLRENEINLGGHPGRHLEIQLDSGEIMLLRQYVVDNCCFQVLVGASAARIRADKGNIQRFLDSFVVTTPTREVDAPVEAETPRATNPRKAPEASPTPDEPDPQPGPPQQRWQEFTSYSGGFRILCPSEPEASTKKGRDYTHQVQMCFDPQRQMGFVVSYADLPEPLLDTLPTADKRLDHARDRIVAEDKLLMERKMRLAGHCGRDLAITRGEDGVMYARLFMVDQRLYQIGVVGPVDDVTLSDPDVRRFIDSFALIPVVTDAGRLQFEDIQARRGHLGPVCESLEVLPFDPIDFRAILTGILTDNEGRVDVEWELNVTDAQGETMLERSGRCRDVLGRQAERFPFSATVTLPDRPGRYKLQVTVRDHLSSQQTSFQRALIAKPLEFAIVGLRFCYDEAGNVPAPPGGVEGQALFVKLRAIGFDRSLDQIDMAMTMQLINDQGRPVLPRSVTAEVSSSDAQAVQQAPFAHFDARLPLPAAGNYRLRIAVHDRMGNNFTRQETAIRVTSP